MTLYKIDIFENENLYNSEIYLSKNLQLFFSELDVNECKIEELFTYLENEKNEKFYNRKTFACSIYKNKFNHENDMIERYKKYLLGLEVSQKPHPAPPPPTG